MDALEEFRVETSNSSAEFGNVTGATINATIKSGTNELPRQPVRVLSQRCARRHSPGPITASRRRPAKPKLRQNIFGGTLGGPIIKEKVFFFVDYQGTLQRTGGGSFIRRRSGGLADGRPVQLVSTDVRSAIHRPAPTRVTRRPAAFSREASSRQTGSSIRWPRRCSPIRPCTRCRAASIRPIGTGILDVVTGNEVNGHQFDVKIDCELSDKDNLSARYSFANFDARTVQGSLPIIPGSRQVQHAAERRAQLDADHQPEDQSTKPASGSTAQFSSPTTSMTGPASAISTPGSASLAGRPTAGSRSITLGSGLTNIGGSGSNENNVHQHLPLRRQPDLPARPPHVQDGRPVAEVSAEPLLRRQQRHRSASSTTWHQFTGVQFADFLLDQLQRKALGGAAGTNKGTWGHRQNRIGLFFQDDFKMRHQLHLNPGHALGVHLAGRRSG